MYEILRKEKKKKKKEKEKTKDKIEWIRNDKKGQNKHLKLRTHAKITTATATIVTTTTKKTTKFDDHQEKKEIVKCLPSYLIKITLFKWLVKHIAC